MTVFTDHSTKTGAQPFAEPRLILEHREIAPAIWQLTIEYAQAAAPGQFVNLYLDSADLLLPRPISVCAQTADRLTLVYAVVGSGTGRLAQKPVGSRLRVSQPLGQGYDISFVQPEQNALLIGGGLGIPPLLHLARQLKQKGMAVIAALGFRETPFLTEEFSEAGATVETITELTGRVTDLLAAKQLIGDACFACGPKPMLLAVTEYLAEKGRPVQVSLEERLGCGYGACVGCICQTHDPDGRPLIRKICKDGPVFWGSEVAWHA